ncbi:MAG: HU family DNA-binding protein [Prevotella sp.]|jgi:DNA-binding protein HU-beta|nr:HU family DNA-binding protein [Prevotella sp.]
MNKTELVKKIAEKADLSQVAAKDALDAALDAIQAALQSGESIQLLGFGTFSVTERSERTAKNPRTGEVVKVPAKKVAKFKASSSLI